MSTSGTTLSSPRGSCHARCPSRAITAGTSVMRTTNASASTPNICSSCRSRRDACACWRTGRRPRCSGATSPSCPRCASTRPRTAIRKGHPHERPQAVAQADPGGPARRGADPDAVRLAERAARAARPADRRGRAGARRAGGGAAPGDAGGRVRRAPLRRRGRGARGDRGPRGLRSVGRHARRPEGADLVGRQLDRGPAAHPRGEREQRRASWTSRRRTRTPRRCRPRCCR